MKVSKLIVPLLGLTNISNNVNNANNQISQVKAIQWEKGIKLSMDNYEVVVDNWDKYLTDDILTNKNITENLIQEIQDKIVVLPNTQKGEEKAVGKPIQFHSVEECTQILQASLALCAGAGPFYLVCVAAAQAAFLACIASSN